MGLRLKYNLVLLLACLLGVVGATGIAYFIIQKSAIAEIRHSINVVHANVTAVRSYTVTSITPLLSDDNDILFMPESVAAYAARSVFTLFQKKFPEFGYKEAALNPTNPADLANPFETTLIEKLRADPSLDQIAQVVDGKDGRFLTVAFPLTIQDEGCLTCHSTPDVAPPAMIDLYGPNNGFGWKMGETIGAQIITAPMSIADSWARETGLILIAGFSVIFLLVFVMTNIMLGKIVLRPVRKISDMAQKVSMGDFTVPEYRKPGKDEISSLSASFNLIRRSLQQAMSMIDV
jgi:protein-histidine pros-kinase